MRAYRGCPSGQNISLIIFSFLLAAAYGVSAEETPPPCDLPDSADEHMEFRVSYMRIPIGTVDLYYSDEGDGCGLLVMETFPNIRLLRAYTEYFGLLAADGYIREGHFRQEKNDDWEHRKLIRDPESNYVVHSRYTADSRFGALGDRQERKESPYTSPGHNTLSLIQALRNDIADDEPGAVREAGYPFYFGGERQTLPLLRREEQTTVSVDAFDGERDVVNTEITIDFEGVYGLRDTLKVQFTADASAIPVYAEARIAIGRIRLELTGYEGSKIETGRPSPGLTRSALDREAH